METVQIKIKSPSANISDLEFKCDLDEEIIQIKKRISESYPTKPAESAQKLVYSGKILKDSDQLQDILRFEDECSAFTFHLVCSIPHKQKSSLPTTADGLRQRSNASSASTSGAALNASLPAAAQPIPNQTGQMEEMMRTFSTQYTQAMASMPSTPSEAEVAAMQQMYSQYLSLYMQYIQSQALPQQSQVLLQQNFANQQQLNRPVNFEPNAAPAAAVGEGAPNAAMVMNAGAAGQIQDGAGGDRNRDILDWVYVMTRVLLLFSVIYFHSSFLRLAFVAGLGFLVYLYQNRRNGRLRVRNQNQQPGPEQQQQQEPEAGQAEENAEEANVEAADSDETNEEEAPLVEEPKPSRLALVFTFFTTLVSSIIPEQPQVI